MDRKKLAAYEGREQASVKHFLLESYLERLIMITAQARYDRIAYIDAFAGPWASSLEDLSDTSFARAIEVMEGCRVEIARRFHRSVLFRALFVERNPNRYAQLEQFALARSTNQVEITALNEDFAESSESVASWIRDDEMAFVLIDPTGWKEVISARTLAPLLRKPRVELLSQVGVSGGQNWMRAYLRELRSAAGDSNSRSRLRTAWFPVKFPDKERVFYYLTYVTHHAKGMIVFLEESERALRYQKQVKFVVKQKRREAATRIADIFGDDFLPDEGTEWSSVSAARSVWLELLPVAGAEERIDEARIADMAEQCGCRISHLQISLRRLIDDGVLQNTNALRARPKNVVDYHRPSCRGASTPPFHPRTGPAPG